MYDGSYGGIRERGVMPRYRGIGHEDRKVLGFATTCQNIHPSISLISLYCTVLVINHPSDTRGFAPLCEDPLLVMLARL